MYRMVRMYIGSLNRVGVNEECDGRSEGQTDRQPEPPLATARSNGV